MTQLADVTSVISNLIAALTNPGSGFDGSAESNFYACLNSNPAAVVHCLLQLVSDSVGSAQLVSIQLLTRVVELGVLEKVGGELHHEFQRRMLECVEGKKVAGAENLSNLIVKSVMFYHSHGIDVSEFARNVIAFCQSVDNVAASIGLAMLQYCVENRCCGEIPPFDEVFELSLKSQCPERIRVTFRVMYALFGQGVELRCYEQFGRAFPEVLRACNPQFATVFLGDASQFMQPQFFTEDLFRTLIEMYRNREIPTGVRVSALELILDMFEAHWQVMAPFTQGLLEIMIEVMCEIDPSVDIYSEDYEDTTPRTATEEGIDRLTYTFMDNNDFTNAIKGAAYSLLGSDDLRKKRAGIVMLIYGVENARWHFQDIQERMVAILHEIQPNGPALCVNALLQLVSAMSKNYATDFQRDYAPYVLPILTTIIARQPSRCALEALASFLGNSDNAIEFSDEIIELLCGLVKSAGSFPPHIYVYIIRCFKSLIQTTGYDEGVFGEALKLLVQISSSGSRPLLLECMVIFASIGQFVEPSAKALATIDIADLTKEELTSFHEALRLFIPAMVKTNPEESRVLVSRIMEAAQQDIEKATRKGPVKEEGMVAVYNQKTDETDLYSQVGLDEATEALTTLSSFISSIDGLDETLSQGIVGTLDKCIVRWYSSSIEHATMKCATAFIDTLARGKCQAVGIMAKVINSFLSVIDKDPDASVRCDFLTMLGSICDWAAVVQGDLNTVGNLIPAIKMTVNCGEWSVLTAGARALDKYLSVTKNAAAFDQEFQTLYSDASCPAKWLAWSSLLKHCDIPAAQSSIIVDLFQAVCAAVEQLDELEVPLESLAQLLESHKLNGEQLQHCTQMLTTVSSALNGDYSSPVMHGLLAKTLTLALIQNSASWQQPPVLNAWLQLLPLPKCLGTEYSIIYDVFTKILLETPIFAAQERWAQAFDIIAKASTSGAFSPTAKSKANEYLKRVFTDPQARDVLADLSEKRQDALLSFMIA